MKYVCQLDYEHQPYHYNVENGGLPEVQANVARGGCGLCSACMMVEHLTTKHFTVRDAVMLSENCGANKRMGTTMRIFGPAVAQMFDLDYSTTNDREELVKHLQEGGAAIVNVGGTDETKVGHFTPTGHYMFILSTDGENVCFLDPSYREVWYASETLQKEIRKDLPFLYCSLDFMLQEASNRDPGFYLFKRKTP